MGNKARIGCNRERERKRLRCEIVRCAVLTTCAASTEICSPNGEGRGAGLGEDRDSNSMEAAVKMEMFVVLMEEAARNKVRV
jgi:hypothetical protein